MEPVQKRDWMTREEAEAFVGKNASYYLEKWKLHGETALKGWNWAAMFFGIEWMVYRKMYLETVLFYVVIFCVTGAASLLFNLNADLWGYGIRILIGVVGNALYRKKALRTLHKIDARSDAERLAALSKRGGVSPAAVIVLILLELAYGFFVFVII